MEDKVQEEKNEKLDLNERLVLLKGTVIKLQGLPFILNDDTIVVGVRNNLELAEKLYWEGAEKRSLMKEETRYAKKWDEILKGNKNTKAYRRLKKIREKKVVGTRVSYGEFWKDGEKAEK